MIEIEKFREPEETYKIIFEGATDGILVADVKTKKFVLANPKICEITGYSLKELLKLDVTNIHPKKDLSHALDEFAKLAEEKITLVKHLPVLRKDKKVVYCDISGKIMEIGKQKYLVGFFRDITEWRRTEEELKSKIEELERFSELAVGRELKMIELKKRIEELEDKLNNMKKR